MTDRLSPQRETEIRESHPGDWYAGEWRSEYVEASGSAEPAYYKVFDVASGTTLATLPDFAGPIALFIADAHDAVPELLAQLAAVRAERDDARAQLADAELIVEYGVRLAGSSEAERHHSPQSASDEVWRLRGRGTDAVLVRRDVLYGEWTEAAS